MSIILVPLQYKNNISNNKNNDIMKLTELKMRYLNELVQLGWSVEFSNMLMYLYPPSNCGFIAGSVIRNVCDETGLYLLGYDFDGKFCFKFCV